MIMSPFHSQSNTSDFPQRVPLSQFTPTPYLYPNEVRHMVAQTWQERIDHMLQRWWAVECSSMAQMFSWMLMECWERERERETERLSEDEGEGHEREQLIFMWPAPSRGGRLGDDGCEGEMRKERHEETKICERACVREFVWVYDIHNTVLCQYSFHKGFHSTIMAWNMNMSKIMVIYRMTVVEKYHISCE